MSEMTSIPEQKRPALHKLIDELPAEELELVERVLARLEMDRLWKETQEGLRKTGMKANMQAWMI
ncbi:hypothetical protein WJU23_13630 [Prosthecobacter sp. SYSU 5D2]|uniref:hypothetical protein n=1 Tax=Prosthecobacter sp. SYSU 5D2 TaxID=3134134 RepID=UPI0031FE682D